MSTSLGCSILVFEDKSLQDSLKFANASAYFNLKNETACGGAAPLKTIEKFITEGTLRDF